MKKQTKTLRGEFGLYFPPAATLKMTGCPRLCSTPTKERELKESWYVCYLAPMKITPPRDRLTANIESSGHPTSTQKNFSPRNKPWAVDYWLSGQSNETDIPHSDDIVNLVDPDFLFLTQLNYNGLEKGKAIVAEYAMGGKFVKEMAPTLCDGHCVNITDILPEPELARRYSYGAPYMMIAEDMLHYTALWKDLVDLGREVYPGSWSAEQMAAIFAGIRLGIDVTVVPLMISYPPSIHEPWKEISWYSYDHGPIQYAHYCQLIEVNGFSFSKNHYNHLDLRKCDRSQQLKEPTPEQWEKIVALHGGDLMDPSKEDRVLARNAWFLWNVYMPIRDSILAYYEDMCPPQHTSRGETRKKISRRIQNHTVHK